MKRKTHFLCSVVLILATAARAHGDDVDDFVKKIMQQRHIPAISIAVVKDGVVVKTAAYGLANMEHNVPARPDTVYKIGSTSKQFIASGIMLLVQDGKIAVDDKVSKYLEGTPASWQDITVRRLLTHTSGLAREGPAFDPYKVQPDIDVIKSAYSVALLFKPGDRYEYSNLGYFTLAEIIHRVSGKPWDQFINERIFAPLGMTATRATNFFDIVANRAGRIRLGDGQIHKRRTLDNSASQRRVPVHRHGHGEVGSSAAIRSDFEGIDQSGNVDAGHAEQRTKVSLRIWLGT
jgi:CubicO group peptidase (beta-lactamase class C family)